MIRCPTCGVTGKSTMNRGTSTLRYRSWRLMVVVAMGALTTGCASLLTPSYPVVPMHEAVRRVNENNAKLEAAAGGLKGSPVEATGRLRERKGAWARHFSLTGVVGFHRPRDLILQLREGLGGAVVMQAGSNDDEYWLWVKPEIDTLWWGTYSSSAPETASDSAPSEDMPIRPDDLIDALGLTILPGDTTAPDGPLYRTERTRNVLTYLQKEYYLDRAAPYLIREIVYREPDGRERMHAVLSQDGPVLGSDALMAHKIRIEWRAADSWFELRIRRITLETEPFLSPESPRDQGVKVKREIHVNSATDDVAEVSPKSAIWASRLTIR